MSSNQFVSKAKKIITENIYMTIATASKAGKPWISPVFFVCDYKYNLYWVSNKDSLHSNLVRKNPQIAIVIFDSSIPEGKGDGVYFEAKGKELTDEKEINKAIALWNQRAKGEDFKIKGIEEVTKKSVWRVYKATPIKISKLTEGKSINGQYVDHREEINL